MNKILLIGNVGSDVDVRPTRNGGKMATLSLATNKRWKDKSGNPQEETQWHRIIAFGNLAELTEAYVKKGMQIFVEGEMKYGKYENEQGVNVYTADVVMSEIKFLSKRDDLPSFD